MKILDAPASFGAVVLLLLPALVAAAPRWPLMQLPSLRNFGTAAEDLFNGGNCVGLPAWWIRGKPLHWNPFQRGADQRVKLVLLGHGSARWRCLDNAYEVEDDVSGVRLYRLSRAEAGQALTSGLAIVDMQPAASTPYATLQYQQPATSSRSSDAEPVAARRLALVTRADHQTLIELDADEVSTWPRPDMPGLVTDPNRALGWQAAATGYAPKGRRARDLSRKQFFRVQVAGGEIPQSHVCNAARQGEVLTTPFSALYFVYGAKRTYGLVGGEPEEICRPRPQ
ncbi:MAG: hypothetical protein M1826_002965 [Phylliscum demangeonii]|nr:MAG: hypothetical protein M1826_002965 [Phylliscum demangeonii]